VGLNLRICKTVCQEVVACLEKIPKNPDDYALLTKIIREAFKKLVKNMNNTATYPDPERYREEALWFLEHQLTLGLQLGQLPNTYTSILERLDRANFMEAFASRIPVASPSPLAQPTPPEVIVIRVTAKDADTGTPPVTSSSKTLRQLAVSPDFTVSVIQSVLLEPRPTAGEPRVATGVPVPITDPVGSLVSHDLNTDVSANVRVSIANVRKGHCDACGAVVTTVPEQFRAHVVNDHRLVVETLGRADMAETVEKLCNSFAVPDRPGLYSCSIHELSVSGRDTLLQHLALEHEMIFHLLLVCHLYGTRHFVSCPFPECALKIRWSYDRYPRHLLQVHLKRYVEMEMVQAQKKCKTVRPNVCPREGCGFPQFLNLLVVHYANEHQVLQDVFKNFASVNCWDTQQFQNYGFFKPMLRSTSGSALSKDLVGCPKCGAEIQPLLICLHIDQCLEKGKLANYLRNQLKLCQVDLYQSYSCPAALCSSKPSLPFSQLFNHWLLLHNLYGMSPEQYRLYAQVSWPQESGPPADLPHEQYHQDQPRESSSTSAQPANSTVNKAASVPVVKRINLGHIKSLVRAQVRGVSSASVDATANENSTKDTPAAALPSGVVEKSAGSGTQSVPAPVTVHVKGKIVPPSTTSHPSKEYDKIACPFSFDGKECLKTFLLCGRKAALACFDHIFIHVVLNNPSVLASSMEKVNRMAGFTSKNDLVHSCPIAYCKKTVLSEKEGNDHFSDKHGVEIVAIYLMDNSMHSLLHSLSRHTPRYFQSFIEKYQRLNPPASTSAAAAIQIQDCFSVDDRRDLTRDDSPPAVEGPSEDVILLGEEEDSAVAGLLAAEGVPGRSEEEEVEIVAAVASVTGEEPLSGKAPAVAAPPAPKSPGIVFVPPRYRTRFSIEKA
jgi:hypothetical protein